MNNSINTAHKITITLLKSFFLGHKVLISTPYFNIVPASAKAGHHDRHSSTSRIIVQLFYFVSPMLTSAEQSIPQIDLLGGLTTSTGPNEIALQASRGFSDHALQALGTAITRLYPQNVSVELQIVRQYHPYMNASILAQYLAINASKYGFHRMITILLNAVPYVNPFSLGQAMSCPEENASQEGYTLPSCTAGVKVQLSGLLTSQRNPARKTVYTASAGTFSGPNTVIDYANSTSKSRVGSFNVKVWLCSVIPT